MTNEAKERICMLQLWIEKEIFREPDPDAVITGIIAGRRNAELAEYARRANVTAFKRALNRMYATTIGGDHGY